MNPLLVYFLLLKASLLSFNGPTTLPVVRHDFVLTHKVLTDRQLNAAVTAGRAAPGPMGMYLVSVGYYVAGIPGAVAGLGAVVTPAFLVIPILRFAGARANRPRVRSALSAILIASCVLILHSAWPLVQEAMRGPLEIGLAMAALVALLAWRVDTVWIIVGAALIDTLWNLRS